MKPSTGANASPIHDRLTRDSDRTSLPRQSASRHSTGRSRAGKRILLVDDDATVRDSLEEVLTSEGYCVVPAANGEAALHLAARCPVDLVLLDLNMPVKNGWETFQQFTAAHPLIPIIIATARPNQLFTALGAGAGALLEKPMDIPTLLRTMAKLLAQSGEQHLARLAGKENEFHYRSATTLGAGRRPAKTH